MTAPRRGWRETIEPGIYRAHRVACRSSADQETGRRCRCPLQLAVSAPGSATKMVSFIGSLTDARAERRRLASKHRPTSATGTLDELAASYFQAREPVLSEATIRNRDEDYRRRILPVLGELPISEVDRERVEAFVAGLARTATSHRMLVQTVATLRAMLSTAVEWGRIERNPAMRLTLPAPPQGASPIERVLAEDELGLLFDLGAATLRVETMLRAAGEAGLRKGEVIGLRWPDVLLPERRLRVERAVWQRRADGGPPVQVVKTTKGRRARRVALSPGLVRSLGAWYAAAVVEGGADAAGYVWPGRDGVSPMNECSPNTALERALRRASLVEAVGGRTRGRISFHGLRHSAAAVMFARNVSLLVISRQLGHASTQVTSAVYEHLARDEQLDAAAAAFDGLAGAEQLRGQLRAEEAGL